MMIEAKPLDITHTVDPGTVEGLMTGIREDRPYSPR